MMHHDWPDGPMLSIVIPTYNEAENILPLVRRIEESVAALGGPCELIFVDDSSPDGTAEEISAWTSSNTLPLRLIQRPQKMGLASAAMDGFAAARGGLIGLMDADLSHPPEAIPLLVRPLLSGEADLCVGSRYMCGSQIKDWGLKRRVCSRCACALGKTVTNLSDPLSGFFFMERSVIEGMHLTASGFKIGLEILVKGNCQNILEVPITFTDRLKGQSKLTSHEMTAFMSQILRLLLSRKTFHRKPNMIRKKNSYVSSSTTQV